MSARYFCDHCNGRVSPYDRLGSLTTAPVDGALGGPVLLKSLNDSRKRADPDNPQLMGFCWTCEIIVETTRVTYQDMLRIYLRSMGRSVRVEGRSEKARLRDLEERLGGQLLEAM